MKRSPLIPPVIADCVSLALSGVADIQFLDASVCPECAGLLMSHDLKKRRFSTLQTENGPNHIYVYIKRYYCRDCGHLCYADAPFYLNSRFGAPVVDLCLTLCRDHSYSQTSTILQDLGIIVDRGTVRKMALAFSHQIPVVDLYGIMLPQSILALSALVMQSMPSGALTGAEVLKACGFPINI